MTKSSTLSAFLPHHFTAAIASPVATHCTRFRSRTRIPVSIMRFARARPTCPIASQAKPIKPARSVTKA